MIVLTGFAMFGLAAAGPFIWVDRSKLGERFFVAVAFFAAVVAYGAAVAQELVPVGMRIPPLFSVAEVMGMLASGAAIFIALTVRLSFARSLGINLGLMTFVVAVSSLYAAFGGAVPSMLHVATWLWMGSTVAGLAINTCFEYKAGQRSSGLQPAVILALAFCGVHAAQGVRLLSESERLAESVFVTAPVVFLVLLFYTASALSGRGFPERSRYAKSGMSASQAEALFANIEELMASSKPYTDPKLDRASLAQMLQVSSRDIGEAINRVAGKSFLDYLREARVREAERLIAAEANDRVSLESLGMAAGFRSRSAFYAAFNRVVGTTPGAWRRRG